MLPYKIIFGDKVFSRKHGLEKTGSPGMEVHSKTTSSCAIDRYTFCVVVATIVAKVDNLSCNAEPFLLKDSNESCIESNEGARPRSPSYAKLRLRDCGCAPAKLRLRGCGTAVALL